MLTLWLIILIQSSHYSSINAVDSSLLPQTEDPNIETTTTAYQSLQKRSFHRLDPVDESTSDFSTSEEDVDKSNDENDVTTPRIAPLVLQPNVANAIDAPDGGLLVPLVIPAVATATNTNLINTNDTANPLLISDLNLTTTKTDPNMLSGETDSNAGDMDVAEDIVFRPLFRYRQEQREQLRYRDRARYYQPYLYTNNRYY